MYVYEQDSLTKSKLLLHWLDVGALVTYIGFAYKLPKNLAVLIASLLFIIFTSPILYSQ
jgi:hypothetical protein